MGINSPVDPIILQNSDGILAYPGYLAPTYGLNFLQGYLDNSLTFTRASPTASYYNSLGLIAQAGANVPRFDYNPITLSLNGLLIEQVSTNLVTYSSAMGASPWVNNGIATTFTPNAGIAPDGSTAAALIAPQGMYGGTNLFVEVTNGATYTFTAWVKWVSGNTTLYVSAFNGTSTIANSFIATTAWQRVSVTFTTTNTTITVTIQDRLASGWGSFLVWGAQLENLPFFTSYIPTVASPVTRAVDTLVNTNITSWLNATNGAFQTEALVPYSIPSHRAYTAGLSDGSGNNLIADFLETNGIPTGGNVISGTVNLSGQTLAAVSSGVIFKSAVSYKAGSNAFSAYGQNDTAGTFGASGVPTVSRLIIGDNAVATRNINGWIRRFNYWNYPLTAEQLRVVTT